MAQKRTAVLCVAAVMAATLQTAAAAAATTITGATAVTTAATGGAAVTTAATGGAAVTGSGRAAGRTCTVTERPDDARARKVRDIVRQAQKGLGLKAALVRVTVDGRELVTDGVGESMNGVPATPAMHFRVGSVGIAYLGTVLLQLVDEHKVSLDDHVSRWLPGLPHGDKITLRMLGDATSGLHDYVTDPVFVKRLYADPFRHWTPQEVVGISTSHPLWYEPGTNWSYSHADFVLLGTALEKITGTPLDRLLSERVLGPLGLGETRNGATPEIPQPVLHAYDDERGPYEDASYWDPSWTTAPGAVLTSDICDLARSAQAIGSGELLSHSAFATQLNPGTVGLGHRTAGCPASVCLPQTEVFHFGIGVIVKNGWVLQNPSFAGYAAVQAYQPDGRLAIAVSTTAGPRAANGNTAQTITERIAAALAPHHPLTG
ncbi:serine hydrolase domain-containing protein [Streptomyces sp. NPDC020801]|uniref:serine hydrolase domain-containing protein n=1 Tax=unclassified Streptomyces TaxID=2593676 RepID=UPI0037B67181